MADKTLRLGDSQNYLLTFLQDDGVTAIDLTGGVVKFAMKKKISDTNAEALVFKTSYDSDEIEITNAAGGLALLKLLADDTYDQRAGTYCWDMELSRRGTLVTNTGTIDVTAASGSLVASGGFDPTLVKYGDVVVPSGSGSENQVTCTVIGVTATAIVTDYTGWTTEAGISLAVYRGDKKTPAGMSGAFTLSQDVVN